MGRTCPLLIRTLPRRLEPGGLFDRAFEFRDGLVVIIKRILCRFPGGPRSLRCTSLGARLHSSQGAHHRVLIDTHIQISRRAEVSMSENLLRNLDVPGRVENSLSQCVTEKMWMNSHTRLTSDVAQRRLERRITERLAMSLARCNPESIYLLEARRSASRYLSNSGQKSSVTGTRCSSRAPFKRTVIVRRLRSMSSRVMPKTPCRPASVLQSPMRWPVRLSSVRIALSRQDRCRIN